jgi:hypothetical protein
VAAQPIARALVEAKQDRVRMNKFQVIADGMATRRKAWDQRADALLTRMAALDPVAELAFAGHEAKLAEAEAGFREMESAVRDLAGGNGPEGSPDSGKPSDAKG